MTRRRGTILFTVLLAVAIGAMVGTTLLLMADTDRRSATARESAFQDRALALSGLTVVMRELASQRESILRGEAPRITASGVVFGGEGRDGRRGVFEIVAPPRDDELPGPDDPENRALLEAEAGKLNLRRASREALASLDALDLDDRESLLAAFDAGVRDSVTGIALSDAARRLFTGSSFEPEVQSGAGVGGEAFADRPRHKVTEEWPEALAQEIRARAPGLPPEPLEEFRKATASAASRTDLVRALAAARIGQEHWGVILDTLTATDEPDVAGRIDLMTAPARVLATVSGIDSSAAERIVQRRTELDAEERTSLAWPLRDGILTVDQFAEAADHLTTRSLQYRVVVRGSVRAGDRDREPGGNGGTGQAVTGTDLSGVVLEAIIDLSEPRPRLAFLREATLAPLAKSLAARYEPPNRVDTPPALPSPRPQSAPGPGRSSRPERATAGGRAGENEGGQPAVTERNPGPATSGRTGRWRSASGEDGR